MNLLDSTPIKLITIIIFSYFTLAFCGHGHSHHEHFDSHDESPAYKYSKQANELYSNVNSETNLQIKDPLTLWMEAIGSTLLISVAPFIFLFFIPIDNRIEHEPSLKILLSFASGGLLGDVFFHLIPHALSPHSDKSTPHSHNDSHSEDHGHELSVGLGIMLGIMVFLMVEKFVRIVKGGHEHSHLNRAQTTKEQQRSQEKEGDEDESVDYHKDSYDKDTEQEKEKKIVKEVKPQNDIVTDIKVAGYLNLAADFLHNFTDGLAIGASYIAGRHVGIITTAIILLHEVPHEIGDFAILIQSGCSKKKAIFLQLITAVGALVGTVCSLLAEGLDASATNWILPFTAGGFIYIATVSIIPELLEDTKFLIQSIKEVVALFFGAFMMYLIAAYE